jgi:hypothetical protein
MGVRYLVVPEDAAPGEPGRRPVPALVSALSQQLDLVRVDVDPQIHVFRNAAWVPSRSSVAAGSLPTDDIALDDYVSFAHARPITGATPVLAGADGYASWTSDVPAGEVYLAAGSSNWLFDVAGARIDRREVYGWASAFTVDAAGGGALRHDTPAWYHTTLVAQVVLWLIVLGVLRAATIRNREADYE